MARSTNRRKPRSYKVTENGFEVDPSRVLRKTDMLASRSRVAVITAPVAWLITVDAKNEEEAHEKGLQALRALRPDKELEPHGPFLRGKKLWIVSRKKDVGLVGIDPKEENPSPRHRNQWADRADLIIVASKLSRRDVEHWSRAFPDLVERLPPDDYPWILAWVPVSLLDATSRRVARRVLPLGEESRAGVGVIIGNEVRLLHDPLEEFQGMVAVFVPASVEELRRIAERRTLHNPAKKTAKKKIAKKKAGPLSDARFWEIVDQIDWRSMTGPLARGESPHINFEAIRCELLLRHDESTIHRLEKAWNNKRKRLMKRIQEWENETGQSLPAGDDAFIDLVNHIIGLGKAEYDAVLKDPDLAMKRAEAANYEESFAYTLPDLETSPLATCIEGVAFAARERGRSEKPSKRDPSVETLRKRLLAL